MYQNFVEIGRVGLVHFGDNRGKLAVILDVINENRVVVENQADGLERQVIPIKRLTLTRFRVPINRAPRTGVLNKALEKFDLKGKWAKTSTAQKIAINARRAKLNDFDRFRVLVNKRRLAHGVRKHVSVALRGDKKKKPAQKTDAKKTGKK